MSFKSFSLGEDVASGQSSINESISISGSIFEADPNIKFYKSIASGSADGDLGGYFETAYDASPTSSLSTALFDITYGLTTSSAYYVAATNTSSLTEKVKIYRQMAAVCLGNPDSRFTVDSVVRNEAFFVLIKRGLQKDEIKKGATAIVINSEAPAQYTASDQGAVTAFKQTNGGDYAPLKYNGTGSEMGQVWYNAGVIVFPPDLAFGGITLWSGSLAKTLINVQSSGNINALVDGFRQHVERVDFHNQTNLQSTIFFCRAHNTEFNYSSNPTYVDANKKIRVTSGSNIIAPRAYITTVGVYDENDNLLATGKLSKPIVKSFENEAIIRLRLDY